MSSRGYLITCFNIVHELQAAGLDVGELITSGTPAAPYALTYRAFRNGSLLHRVSPERWCLTTRPVLNNFQPNAAMCRPDYYFSVVAVLLHEICHVRRGTQSVSADAGVPTCSVVGKPHLKPLKPSEEHLPIESLSDDNIPSIGDKLYLVPRHICPTVNNFDQALFVVDGQIRAIEPVTARGHETPLVLNRNVAL